MRKLLEILRPIFSTLLFLGVIFLALGLTLVYREVKSLKVLFETHQERLVKNPSGLVKEEFDGQEIKSLNGAENFACLKGCQDEIKRRVDEAVAKITVAPAKSNLFSTTSKDSQERRTSYIPMGTASTTTSTDWYSLDDTQVFIDLKNDFSEDAYITWEASLKVAHGNGQAFARLWDDTNKIAVNGSEISTTNNSEFSRVASSRLFLWSGNNSYKVQVKSLNSFEVTYSNGKIKITY